MKMTLRGIGSLAVLSAITLVPAATFAATVALKADLQAATEVPPKESQGHGTLSATFDTKTNMLHYHVVYAGLTSAAMAAHFHGPAAPGINAGPQIAVPGNLASPVDRTVHLTPQQAKDLLDGQWYFNIHTADNQGGEIRGQVVK